MILLINVLSAFALLAGAFFCFTGAFGLLRLRTFFVRMHGAAVLDSLGAILILAGLALQAAFNPEFASPERKELLVAAKLVMILIFLMITGPTAVHALAKAALHGDVPLGKEFDTRKHREKKP